MKVVPVPVLSDNYAYLVIDEQAGKAAVVDPSEASPVLERLHRERARLAAIWNTHHHWDHVGGNRDLAAAVPGLEVFGYGPDRPRIPCLTHPVEDGTEFRFGNLRVQVLFIPAHTSGHVAYYLPDEGIAFTGDTLFAAGCGRLFEGDPATMVSSLGRLAALPAQTRIYCGHEYTEKNLAFALTLEPQNPAIRAKYERVREARRRGEPTVPTTVAEELETNPFLRCSSPELVRSVKGRFPDTPDDPVAVFARVRQLKDSF
jgi:hydroxyacylglutathione hydrolase